MSHLWGQVKLLDEYPDPRDTFPVMVEFFRSPDFHAVHSARISCALDAAIAVEIRNGMGPDKWPGAGASNDNAIISSFAPFVDAMVIDGKMDVYCRSPKVKAMLPDGVRFFSIKHSAKELTEYLDEIEASMSPEHARLVNQVYGEPVPYVTLLADLKKRNEQKEKTT